MDQMGEGISVVSVVWPGQELYITRIGHRTSEKKGELDYFILREAMQYLTRWFKNKTSEIAAYQMI